MPRNRRILQRKNRRTARTSTIVRRVTNIDIGVEFKPSLDQPSWSSAPWWPITVVSEASLTKTPYTGVVLHALVIKSLALENFKNGTELVAFNLRVLTVRAWGLDRQPITLDVYDNSNSGCRKLKQLNDRGSPIHYSCLAWRFGKASYAMLNTDCSKDKLPIFEVSQPTASTKISVYVQLLVQRQGVPAAAVTGVPMAHLEETFDCLGLDMDS